MPVAKIEDGVVVQVWRDVDDLHAWTRKYGVPDTVTTLDGRTEVAAAVVPAGHYYVGEAVPGQLWDGEKLVDPPPPPPEVPDRVEKMQLVRALREAAQWDTAKAALAQADEATREDWDMAQVIRRADPLAAFVATAAQLDDAALDELFRAAARL